METKFNVKIGDKGSVPVARDILSCVSENNLSVYIEKDGRKVSANSMIGILSLGIANGDVLNVSCFGGDELAVKLCFEKIGRVLLGDIN